MREIINDSGNLYATVEVDDKHLKIYLAKVGYTVVLDKKVIPQLANILKEAEFFKYI